MSPDACERMVLWARDQICAACGRDDCRPVLGHHVIEQQHLRDVAKTRCIDPVPLLEDERNWLAVGDLCHTRHHRALPRIPRSVLREYCPDVFAMAAELNLTSRLERTYPELVAA